MTKTFQAYQKVENTVKGVFIKYTVGGQSEEGRAGKLLHTKGGGSLYWKSFLKTIRSLSGIKQWTIKPRVKCCYWPILSRVWKISDPPLYWIWKISDQPYNSRLPLRECSLRGRGSQEIWGGSEFFWPLRGVGKKFFILLRGGSNIFIASIRVNSGGHAINNSTSISKEKWAKIRLNYAWSFSSLDHSFYKIRVAILVSN